MKKNILLKTLNEWIDKYSCKINKKRKVECRGVTYLYFSLSVIFPIDRSICQQWWQAITVGYERWENIILFKLLMITWLSFVSLLCM